MTLENVMKEIRKQFGEMSILKLGDEAKRDVEAVSTGALGLAIENSFGVISFGIPMLVEHDTTAYRREAREARNAAAA